eukprot:gene4016-2870_t
MRVVIVGAGLSGLTLANFLTRLNVDCIVLEQLESLSLIENAPYTLYANALSCFKAYEMETLFTPQTTGLMPEQYFGIMNHKQQWLLKVKNREVRLRSLREEDMVPLTTAPRANSNSIVSQRLAEQKRQEMGVVPLRLSLPASHLLKGLCRTVDQVKFGSRVVDLLPNDGIRSGVNVILEDGTSEWGDVVVGADGMHSTIRKLLNPEEYVGTSMSSLGMMQISGFTYRERCPKGLEHPVEMWGNRRRLQTFPLHLHGESKVAFSATIPVPPTDLIDLSVLGHDADPLHVREVFRRMMRKEFSTFGEVVTSLLGEADLAVPVESIEVPVMPRWYNKRAVLLGESAHGSLPSFLQQDASLCVEDAAILATALLDVPLMRDNGFAYAFQQYESVRRERVERYVRQSRRARRFTFTPFEKTRNAILRCTPSSVMYLAQRWLSKWTYSAQSLEVDPKIKLETAFR